MINVHDVRKFAHILQEKLKTMYKQICEYVCGY